MTTIQKRLRAQREWGYRERMEDLSVRFVDSDAPHKAANVIDELVGVVEALIGTETYGELNGATGQSPYLLDWDDIRRARTALAAVKGEKS